jgi:hypothetical protein
MSMRKRNLLVLAAAFSVAPVSARELPAVPSAEHESECPYERAAREAAGGVPTTVTIETDVPKDSLLGASRSSALLP